MNDWNQQRLQQLIDDQIEESQTLEFKGADALGKTDKHKLEITKDVSAMANSAGGILIYGMSEFTIPEKKHLPERLSPISRTNVSKEWLERIINNIKPRIDGLVIHPVTLKTGKNDVAYIIEIPQSTTAHQALDFRYHKRYNFEVLRMLDHEIRDVMGRQQHPKIEVYLKWIAKTETFHPMFNVPTVAAGRTRVEETWTLEVYVGNNGRVLAQYVKCFLKLPKALLLPEDSTNLDSYDNGGIEYCDLQFENTTSDILELTSFGSPKYGPSRNNPALPGLMTRLKDISTVSKESISEFRNFNIEWAAFADNSPQNTGVVNLADILVSDQRENRA